MRLIDADAFIRSIPNLDLPEDTIDACSLRIHLMNAPTVDPVKHGHWIHVEDDMMDYYKTSCCGTATMWMYDKTNYCPNCGAKMDDKAN